MRTCLFLRDYEDIIDPCDIYSLLGMAYKRIKSTSNLSAILAAQYFVTFQGRMLQI